MSEDPVTVDITDSCPTPVAEGDTLTNLEILGFGEHGDAVVRIDGYVLFVNTEQEYSEGDVVDRVRVTSVGPDCGTATEEEE